MINFNPNISQIQQTNRINQPNGPTKTGEGSDKFQNTVKQYTDKVNELQNNADDNVKDLLAGKTEDVNSVVADVAKADMSFKALVGVRNKIIEAYKETMRMQI
ncbi:flagellar hook-basal body protein FliE [Anaerohalosphaera lusitana]|uniref:Flagellar hook-basal body complex protein FliE n=1 Tax=Anaerohalosphaera lusitana TaxID=1936003 RepID=A0A1U9NG37_9BACT|nr:flagellar hook-basal body complex protein FliE [Anaerohalosphaera lusitana]AQT66893.1 flagellar hook-basal body protein FliE [Anaerohalosphaera lusitana]